MKIIITGGGGFIGSQLALRLLRDGCVTLQPGSIVQPVTRIVLVDLRISQSVRDDLSAASNGIHMSFTEGDIADAGFLSMALGKTEGGSSSAAMFHLASIISGDGERDFDLAMRVNLDGTRSLLEHCRHNSPGIRTVLASSLATFGGHALTPVVSDLTKQIPQTTYGMTKLIGELLINDYSRKGFLDGRAARLPTVFIRPGRPNSAASSFASSLFREPLNGEPCALPVSSGQVVPLLSYSRVVDCLVKLLEADAMLLGDDRSVTLPSTCYTIAEMVDALQDYARNHGLELGDLTYAPDPVVQKIVESWPTGTDASRAERLGMSSDTSLRWVIDRYVSDFMERD